MKIELGISLFSKRETLLGFEITTHNGVSVNNGELYDERIVEFSIGIIIAIITIGFVSTGEKLEMPEMDSMKKAIEAFEKEMEK